MKEYVEDIKNISNSKRLLIKDIGDELAKAFKRRLNQMESFDSFAEFYDGHIDNTEALKGNLKGYYSMTLNANYRIIIKPNIEECSIESLKHIKEFKIIGVIDYHGESNAKNKWLIK